MKQSSYIVHGRQMPIDFKKITVLLVEDHKSARETLRLMLMQLGVGNVIIANDGLEALAIVDTKAETIDLIMCDWNMPKMTGIDFLRQIRGANQTIPFLMITGRGDTNSVDIARQSGVNGYILKPFSLAELEKKLTMFMQS